MPSKKKKTEATETHVVTTSAGNVHISQPKGSSRRKQPKITVLVSSEEAVKGSVNGFVGFLRERAVVGVAIAFVVASQMQIFAKSLVDQIITPAFTLLFGWQSLPKQEFTLHWHNRSSTFLWGSVMYAFINFLFIVIALYLIIRFFQLDKLDKKKD
jgi:large-conductance mechanosensitive channel